MFYTQSTCVLKSAAEICMFYTQSTSKTTLYVTNTKTLLKPFKLSINRHSRSYYQLIFTPISHQHTTKVHYLHPKYINTQWHTPKVQVPKNRKYTQSTLYEYARFLFQIVSKSNYEIQYIRDFKGLKRSYVLNYK